MAHNPWRRRNTATMNPAELAIRAAKRAIEAMPAAKELTMAIDLLERSQETVADYIDGVSFLDRFMIFQDRRDHEQEWKDYAEKSAVRLKDSADKNVSEWPLASLLGFPREIPYAVEWNGKFYRLVAQVPAGIISGATHGREYEIVFDEITENDPLRDYEREAGPFKMPEREPISVRVEIGPGSGQEPYSAVEFESACDECGQGHRPGESHGPVVAGYPRRKP